VKHTVTIGKTSKVRFTHPGRLSLYQFPIFDKNLAAGRQVAQFIRNDNLF
jgi:hypothetical protein